MAMKSWHGKPSKKLIGPSKICPKRRKRKSCSWRWAGSDGRAELSQRHRFSFFKYLKFRAHDRYQIWRFSMKRFLLLGAIIAVLGGGVFAYFQYGGTPEGKRERYLQRAREYLKQSKLSAAIVGFQKAVEGDSRSG